MIVTVSILAFLGSLLTFFSGFGLGTILLPVFMFFFPTTTAIALVAIVHLLNNLTKLFLTVKHANTRILVFFGTASVAGAFSGAWVLKMMDANVLLTQYQFAGHSYQITLIKTIIALVMIFFTLAEFLPLSMQTEGKPWLLGAGGITSGFFGGLSGHQGALRSMFLLKVVKSKEELIATGVVIACLVDVVRLSVYSRNLSSELIYSNGPLLASAVLSAIMGALLGNAFLKKVTLGFVQKFSAIGIIIIALLLGLGWI